MDMFGYILCSFRDSCPGFISFRQNTPCVGSRRGTAQGAALLTKWGETAIIKAERALLLVVGLSESANNYNADRLAATERSARFYGQVYNPPCVGSRSGAALLTKWEETAIIKAERALLLVVSFAVLHHIIMNNADRLAGTQAVSTLLWKVPVLKTPRTAEISKKICPFQLHPLPTWILRGASQPLFVTTLLSGPFDGAFLS